MPASRAPSNTTCRKRSTTCAAMTKRSGCIMETVEMPDRLAQDLIMFIRQNGGKLPKKRREKEFAALTDEETKRIEEIYEDLFGDGGS